MPKPMPIIGPINGDISIAPIITAVELTFNPREATKIAKIKIHKFVPLNTTPIIYIFNYGFIFFFFVVQ